MAKSPKSPAGIDEFENPSNLSLDLNNPRTHEQTFETEEEVIAYLVDYADVEELIQSITNSGWLDYEPLVVLADDNIVLEGNRRLAALRILEDAGLRSRLKIELDEEPGETALPSWCAFVGCRRGVLRVILSDSSILTAHLSGTRWRRRSMPLTGIMMAAILST